MNETLLKAFRAAIDWSGEPVQTKERLPAEYLALAARHNGVVAFGGGLRLFGLTSSAQLPSVADWNRLDGWRVEYGKLADGLTFFAETALGDQFGFLEERIVSFQSELGKTTAMADSLGEWLHRVMTDPEDVLSLRIVEQWRAAGRRIGFNEHLCPKYPPAFVLGASTDPSQLYVLDRWKSMRVKGQIASQLRDLPAGAKVRIKTK